MFTSDSGLAGDCVLAACPEHLLQVAARTAFHCLRNPRVILGAQAGLTVFPSDKTLLLLAEESLDDAISGLLMRTVESSEDGEAPRDMQDSFTLAVLWGTLMGIAFDDDIAGGAERGMVEAALISRLGA